ncbi:hypothetical protein D9611_000064 [Ephemerocybe angulata]|uniref:Uncharacterized protein n=1 Tax=Ephemerocybe angulata TaxID=980116 RepID=A0A8H5BNP3_9AGAR|nr:hypothetical protein D9611_000064 [Tulosesus angulatus]
MSQSSSSSRSSVPSVHREHAHGSTTPRQAYNNRDSFITTTSMESGTTSSSGSSLSTSSSLSGSSESTTTLSTGVSSSRRYPSTRDSHRRASSSISSLIQPDMLELEQMIYKVKDQLDFHKRRADAEERRANEAERKCQEFADHLAKVNKARLVAQQDANKANEELRLYKIQLEYAQREINRAQGVLDLVEKQRVTAEKDALEAKSKIRKLTEEITVDHARREGRRQGLQEGLDRGRQLIMQETEAAHTSRRRTSFALDQRSFMNEDYGSDSDDSRTISTISHSTIQADRRNRRHSNSTIDRRAPSPDPLPVPAPAPIPRAPSRAASIAPSTRPVSRAPSISNEPRPRSRAGSTAHEPRPTSRAGSTTYEPKLPSRAPSVAPETRPSSRASRAPSTAYEPPSRPAPPPVIIPDIRPISVQGSYSPGPRFDYTIPPDNLIPTIVNGVISVPPAFEFRRLPTTPERRPSPKLPTESFDSNPPPIHRQSSPESASTTLSQIDLLRDPYQHVAATPALSAIEEVSSQGQASPYPDFTRDFRERSVAGSVGRGGGGSNVGSPYIDHHHQRRQSASSFAPSIHEKAPSVISRSSKLTSAAGTPIHIDVQPPSHPGTEGARSISKSEKLSPLPPTSVSLGSSHGGFEMGSPAGSASAPMSGGGFENSYTGYSRATSPAPSKMKDDDAVSSRISGDDDFFTTPPPTAPKAFKAPESVVSAASGRTSKSKASKKGRR